MKNPAYRIVRWFRKLALLGKPGLIMHRHDCMNTHVHWIFECRCTGWVHWPERRPE